jgi:hypothetical protein
MYPELHEQSLELVGVQVGEPPPKIILEASALPFRELECLQ